MKFSFRTSPPASYIPPTADEMRGAAKKVGLNSFSRDLVADLCNLAAGGQVNPPSSYRSQVQANVEGNLPGPSAKGRWKIGKGYTDQRHVVVAHRVEQSMRYHQNVCDFLQTINLAQFPGVTPLEQAMSLLKLLSKQKGGKGGGEGGEPLPIFTDNDNAEAVGEELNSLMEEVDSLSEEEQDMLNPDQSWQEQEDDGQRQGNKGLNRLQVAEDLTKDSQKRVMLDISRKLDKLNKLQARRQVRQEEDPAGEEIRNRPIRSLSELSRVSKSAWATRQKNKTYFLYQAVTGQLPVRERVTRFEKKQAIFILVDGSGSMKGAKHWKATGVVMNRLKAVLSGDAEVFISVFDTDLTQVESATNADEARELIKKFAAGNFSGGGTDIAQAVRSAHKFMEEEIKAGRALYKPEVLVLTDEDTSISSLHRKEIPGTTVHGFAMKVKNASLVKFAQSTGGIGMDKF